MEWSSQVDETKTADLVRWLAFDAELSALFYRKFAFSIEQNSSEECTRRNKGLPLAAFRGKASKCSWARRGGGEVDFFIYSGLSEKEMMGYADQYYHDVFSRYVIRGDL